MIVKLIPAVTALVACVSAGAASAGEGNGDPFPFQTKAYVTARPASVADTGSDAFPRQAGNRVQSSSLTRLEPAPGSEALIQTALSLPRGAGAKTTAYAQEQSVRPHVAARSEGRRFLGAGEARPGS